MADEKAQLLAEAYRRGLLPPEQKAAYEEARNRGLLGKAVQPKRDFLTQATGFLANVNRGLGVGDELAAGFGSLVKRIPFKNALAQQRTIEDDYTNSNHTMAALGRGIGNAAGIAVPGTPGVNALTQGTRLQNVLGGMAAAGLSGATVAAADRGSMSQRLRSATDPVNLAINSAIGAVGGAFVPSRPRARPVANQADQAARLIDQRGDVDPSIMRAEADRFRAAGVDPTLIDVAGEKGRRFIRAVGVRSDDAGEALVQNARTRMADTKPAAMAATRNLSDDPRTATQLAEGLQTARDAEAGVRYGAFQNQPVEAPQALTEMLNDSAGRSIISRARQDAIENQDWAAQAELDKLLQGGEGSVPRISAGTMDLLAISARERGNNFAEAGRGYRAKGSFGRRDQINETLDAVDDLKPARESYRAQSQAIEVADGTNFNNPFDSDPADYADWLGSLSPQAREANKVAIRQDINDTLGPQKGNSLGLLDTIESSAYFKDNLRQAVGAEEADRYIDAIRARLQQARNASFTSPNAGSRTAVLENDVGKVGTALTVADAAQKGLRGDLIGVARVASDWFRRLGVGEDEATDLARAAVDPARLDSIIAAVEQRAGRNAAQDLIQNLTKAAQDQGADNVIPLLRNASQRLAVARRLPNAATAVTGTSPRAGVEVYVEGRPEYGVGQANRNALTPLGR